MAAFVALAGSIYTAFSASGVWEDDAYIFFRYAKNFASGQGLAFNPGETSFGVTSPLWTLLLSFFIRVGGLEAVATAKILSAALFSGAAGLLTHLFQTRTQNDRLGLWAGTLTAVYPTVLIYMVSGMEVGLNFFLLALLVSLFFSGSKRKFLYFGITVGFLFLTRPENILWLPIILGMATLEKKRFWSKAFGLVFGFAIVALPWEIYLYYKTGLLLPPTGVGKLLLFLPVRYGLTLEEFGQLELGPRLKLAAEALKIFLSMKSGLVFPPFLALGGYLVYRRQLMLSRFWLAGAAYSLGMVTLFIFFFPLVKLRYFIHFYPFVIFVSVLAFYHLWMNSLSRRSFLARPYWAKIGLLVLLLVIPAAWFVASRQYVELARQQEARTEVGWWLKAHLPADARVALEPIGAIGYFSELYLIDLGGLVEPEAWPYMAKGFNSPPDSLLAFLRRRDFTHIVDYSFHQWVAKTVDAFPDSFVRLARIGSVYTPPPENEYEVFKFQSRR